MPDAAVPSHRARWALGGAGLVFAVAVVAAVLSAPSLVPTFRAAGASATRADRVAIDLRRDRALEQQVEVARERVEPALTERFDDARGSMLPLGWEMDDLPSPPYLDCWREDDATGCDLSTHVEGAASVPRAGATRRARVTTLLAKTDAALAQDGWRCDRSLAGRTPPEPEVWQASCRNGAASLRVTFWPRPKAQVGHPRTPAEPNEVSLDIEASAKVYSSEDTT